MYNSSKYYITSIDSKSYTKVELEDFEYIRFYL